MAAEPPPKRAARDREVDEHESYQPGVSRRPGIGAFGPGQGDEKRHRGPNDARPDSAGDAQADVAVSGLAEARRLGPHGRRVARPQPRPVHDRLAGARVGSALGTRARAFVDLGDARPARDDRDAPAWQPTSESRPWPSSLREDVGRRRGARPRRTRARSGCRDGRRSRPGSRPPRRGWPRAGRRCGRRCASRPGASP